MPKSGSISSGEDFKRLGIMGRWDDPYLTMNPAYQAVIARAFVDILDKGYVYKGLKPVNWCIHDRTALAEAEVEYENHKSPSVWVCFALDSDAAAIDPALAGKERLRPDLDDHAVDASGQPRHRIPPEIRIRSRSVGDKVYIVAADLLSATAAKCGWVEPEVIARFTGHKLDRSVFRHPFIDRLRSEWWPITSRWSREPARFTPLPATARRTTSSGRNTACRSIVRSMPSGASSIRPGSRHTFPIGCYPKRSGRVIRSSSIS